MKYAVFLALVVAAGCGGGKSERAGTPGVRGHTFRNPVYRQNFPDPFVLRVGGTYFAYGTNGRNGNVQTLRSTDLVHWRPGKDALPKLGRWAVRGRTWAPEVLRLRPGRYVLFYTARSLVYVQCVGRAVATSPEGPFVDPHRAPLVCQRAQGGSIDPSPYVGGSARYLLWKNDGNCCGFDTYIYSQRLSDDGLRLVGRRARLLKQDAPWEGSLIEAPTLWKEGWHLFLFFSANAYDSTQYAVGYARCSRPLGPCRDAAENPILKTACRAAGPGHQSIVRDPKGRTWVVYHAWPPDTVGLAKPGRVVWIDRLDWRGGKPEIRGPTCRSQQAP